MFAMSPYLQVIELWQEKKTGGEYFVRVFYNQDELVLKGAQPGVYRASQDIAVFLLDLRCSIIQEKYPALPLASILTP